MPHRRSRAATNWIRPSESTPRSASVSSASAAAISGDGSTSESAARTSDRYSNDVLAAASTTRTTSRRFSCARRNRRTSAAAAPRPGRRRPEGRGPREREAARSPEGLPDPPLLHLAGDAAWQVLLAVPVEGAPEVPHRIVGGWLRDHV